MQYTLRSVDYLHVRQPPNIYTARYIWRRFAPSSFSSTRVSTTISCVSVLISYRFVCIQRQYLSSWRFQNARLLFPTIAIIGTISYALLEGLRQP